MGHRLLDIHMLPRLAAPNGGQGMPVIGSGDGYGVYALVFQDAPKIRFQFWPLTPARFEPGCGFRQVALIRIAERGDFHPIHPREGIHVIESAPAHADHRRPDAIVGPSPAIGGEE